MQAFVVLVGIMVGIGWFRNQALPSLDHAALNTRSQYETLRNRHRAELTTADLKSFAVLAFNGLGMYGLFNEGQGLIAKPYLVAVLILHGLSCFALIGTLRSVMRKNRIRTAKDVDAAVNPSISDLREEIVSLSKINATKHTCLNVALVPFSAAIVVFIVGYIMK